MCVCMYVMYVCMYVCMYTGLEIRQNVVRKYMVSCESLFKMISSD